MEQAQQSLAAAVPRRERSLLAAVLKRKRKMCLWEAW
jgi:hypothetical protein